MSDWREDGEAFHAYELLMQEREEWLLSQDFVRNKDDWFRYAESASKFDEFMKARRA